MILLIYVPLLVNEAMMMEQHLQILTSVHRIRARTVEPVPPTPLSTPVTVLWTIQEKTVPIVSNVNALLFNVIRSEDEYSVKITPISMFNVADVNFPKTLRIYTFFMFLQRKYVIKTLEHLDFLTHFPFLEPESM